MRFTSWALALALAAPAAASAQKAIEASKNPVAPGEKVTLRWYFQAGKVIVSGGRFGKGTNVTGQTSVTDTPRKTTTYRFNVAYGEKRGAPGQFLVKTQYSVVVNVVDPGSLGLTTYSNKYGWRVNHVKGWQRDNVPVGDPAKNALVYFQPEMDSIERLGVAIVPVTESSSAALLKKVTDDLPSHYSGVEVLSNEELMYQGVPANLISFAGSPETHPGKRTRSLVLAFVRGGLGYVISGRTLASSFPARKAVLEAMLKSFACTGAASASSAP